MGENKRIDFSDKMSLAKKRLGSSTTTKITTFNQTLVRYENSEVWKVSESNPYPYIAENEYTVYNQLLFFLFSMNIEQNGINTYYFIEYYAKGFKKGLEFLKEERINIENLDDINKRDNTIKRISDIVLNRKYRGIAIINHAFDVTPKIWTEKNIFDCGYYSGIVNSIDKITNQANIKVSDLKQNDKPKEKIKPDKTLEDYFYNINDFDSFINEIEDSFHTDKGKILIGVMRILIDEDLLLIPERGLKSFVECWITSTSKMVFPSYEYINRVLEDRISLDNKFLKPIKIKLIPIIREHKDKHIPT